MGPKSSILQNFESSSNLSPVRNLGSIALEALAPNRGDRVRLARRAGVQPNQITQWIDGHCKPGGKNRLRLSRAFGIAPELWDQYPKTEAA